MNQRSARKPSLAKLVHLIRVAIVIALLWAIPAPSRVVSVDGTPPSLLAVQNHVPAAHKIDPKASASGLWSVQDDQAEPIATIARTLPMAADVVGYRGPTQSLIILDDKLRIQAVSLLSSRDTAEHVDAVVADEEFFQQFVGWPWGGPDATTQVDAVSGATLTSLALAEGVLKRIGGDRPSLVFADELTAEELDSQNSTTGGQLIRTGPLTDDIVGYQGPTELLMTVTPEKSLERVRLRRSYDNEPYVNYVRTERGFWAIFEGKSIGELAALDPEEAGIEGVSGATMTSLAVADTIVAAAKATETDSSNASNATSSASTIRWTTVRWSTVRWSTVRWTTIRWTVADTATLIVLGLLWLLRKTGKLRSGLPRYTWLAMVVVVIGLWAGNLISMSLVAGWAAEGVAWKLAPGLSIMAAAALLTPPLTKGNPYCNHLCPHGAIQQLVMPKPKSKRNLKLPRRLTSALSWVPGVTLVAAYVCLIFSPSIDLSSWEPFHAYLFRIAGWGAMTLATGSLLIAALVPMGYCRFACPTGRLLDHVRRSARSSDLTFADCVSVFLLIMAIAVRLTNVG